MTWAGYLLIADAGTYQFRTVADDGVQVFIDNQSVINNPTLQWFGENQGTATLTAGAHALDVRLFENYTYDGIILQWKKPGDADWSIAPSSVLVTSVPEPGSFALALAGLAVAGAVALRQRRTQ